MQNSDRDIGFYSQDLVKSTINKANSIDIKVIFKKYNIELDEQNKKISCPLPGHNERSPSFYYYPKTNSCHCFGCHYHGGASQLVAKLENITEYQAAQNILKDFTANPNIHQKYDFAEEKRNAILEFSKTIRGFIHSNIEDASALKYAEQITNAYDNITQKHKDKFSYEALKSLIAKMEIKLNQWEKH